MAVFANVFYIGFANTNVGRYFFTPQPFNIKKNRFLLLIALPILMSNFSLAQQSDETIIRQLENAEREAILKKTPQSCHN